MKKIKFEILKILLFGLIFPITYLIFNFTIKQIGLQSGYWVSSIIYWIIISSFTLYYLGFQGILELYKVNKSKTQLWGLIAFIPVIGTFFVSFIPSFPQLRVSLMILTISTGIINGTCEELFWRGLTLKTEFKNKYIVIVASTIGFGLWHLTLATISGLKFQGGIGALVGGAFFMGILWQFVATKTNNIFLVTLAHILVNIFAFSTLILENW
ncbi:MAG: CPBP family intramembrane metalloprotease [Bacteroidales bacterium]|nr:CPBP family intramembrane metalloprotease [Bacteroidales bacterium]